MTPVHSLTAYRLPLILGAAIALKLALLFTYAFQSVFVMDEFWQFGETKHLFRGMYETIWPSKSMGYALFYLPSRWVGTDATSMLLAARIQTALLACGTLALVYGISRNIGETRVRALLAVVIALSFSNMMERIFRTISEPAAVFFAAASLWVAVAGEKRDGSRIIVAGMLSGISFLCTQKAIYFNVALGLALVLDSLLGRQFADAFKRGILLIIGWCFSLAVYSIILGGSNALAVAENLFTGPLQVLAIHGTDNAYRGGLSRYILQTLGWNAFPYLACFAGMVLALVRLTRLTSALRIALIFSVVMTILVFTHSQPWPYVFIMVIPFLALWPTQLYDWPAFPLRTRRLLPFLAGAIVILSFERNISYLEYDNKQQLEVIETAEAALPNVHDRYFDGIGMLPNRIESPRLWLDVAKIQRTWREGQESGAYEGLRLAPPKLIITSYRTDSIYPLIEPLLRDRYLTVAPNIKIAGRQLAPGQTVIFDVPVGGTYAAYRPDGTHFDGPITIDGVRQGGEFDLATGARRVELEANSGEVFVLPAGLKLKRINPRAQDYSLFANIYS